MIDWSRICSLKKPAVQCVWVLAKCSLIGLTTKGFTFINKIKWFIISHKPLIMVQFGKAGWINEHWNFLWSYMNRCKHGFYLWYCDIIHFESYLYRLTKKNLFKKSLFVYLAKRETITIFRNINGEIVMAVYSSFSLLYRISKTYFRTTKCSNTGVTNVNIPTNEHTVMPTPTPLTSSPFCQSIGCTEAPNMLVIIENNLTRIICETYLPLYTDSPKFSFLTLFTNCHFLLSLLWALRVLWADEHNEWIWYGQILLLLWRKFVDNEYNLNWCSLVAFSRWNSTVAALEFKRTVIIDICLWSPHEFSPKGFKLFGHKNKNGRYNLQTTDMSNARAQITETVAHSQIVPIGGFKSSWRNWIRNVH